MAAFAPETVSRLRAIVGTDYVLTSEADLDRYSKCTIPWDKRCSAIVLPGSAEEVQLIVRLANELHLHLWTFGRGKNWGYGTTCAYQDGAVILMLERLNRIYEVNEELAYAVIGPGVSYGELNDYLKSRGLKLWADCTDSTADGSVIGNALERGHGYTQYGDHFASLCGLDVVLPNGNLLRTGGGPENTHSFHTYRYGTGPCVEGLFSQSNLGIVVKAGIWLMPEPERFLLFSCEVKDDASFPDVIDSIRRLALARTINSYVHMGNAFLTMALCYPYPYERLNGKTCLSNVQMEELQRELHLAPWLLSGGLYGPKAQVSAAKKAIQKELTRYGKVVFADDGSMRFLNGLLSWLHRTENSPFPHRVLLQVKDLLVSRSPVRVIEALAKFYPIFKGIPNASSLNMAYLKRKGGPPIPGDRDPARDQCGILWFAPVSPMSGKHTKTIVDLCKPVFAKYGIDFSAGFVYSNPRSVVVLMHIFFDKENADEARRAVALYNEAAELTVRAGYPQYRTSLIYMNRILQSSGHFHDFVNGLKTALDPQNVLSPGRYGIGL